MGGRQDNDAIGENLARPEWTLPGNAAAIEEFFEKQEYNISNCFELDVTLTRLELIAPFTHSYYQTHRKLSCEQNDLLESFLVHVQLNVYELPVS